MDDASGLRLGTYYRTHLLRRLGFTSERGTVVDVGGRDGRWLSNVGDRRILADVEPRALIPSVAYVRASADALPIADAAADAVFSLDVLEHVDDEAALLREAARVLRQGGRLVVTTPSTDIRVFPFLLQGWVDRRWGHHRVRGFEAAQLEKLVRELGLAEVRVEKIGMRAFRWLYFPLRFTWSLPGSIGQRLVAAAAAFDARFLLGSNGWLLLDARR